MKVCIKCCSTSIKVKTENFEEDLHKIVKVFICQKCDYQEKKLVDIEEDSDGK